MPLLNTSPIPITRTTSLLASPAPPPTKKQKMSLTQTYMVAHIARSKLSKEASRADHDLRLLVGHANLLDGLMLDLANAEKEQESWFNSSVKSATRAADPEPRHVQFAPTIRDSSEDAIYDESSDSESDADDEDIRLASSVSILRPISAHSTKITTVEVDEDEEMKDDDEFEADLVLRRTPSTPPPELMHEDEDEDSDSEDESMPPSPPQNEVSFDIISRKQRQSIATTSFYKPDSASIPESEQASFLDEGYYLPQRHTAIAAY